MTRRMTRKQAEVQARIDMAGRGDDDEFERRVKFLMDWRDPRIPSATLDCDYRLMCDYEKDPMF